MKNEKLSAELSTLGFALETVSGPVGKVTPAESKESKPWPHIAYQVRLTFNGKEVLLTDYSLGIGHVDPKASKIPRVLRRLSADDERFMMAWQNKPLADFVDKERQVKVAAYLATEQKVSPELPDVLHSLLMDGEACFGAQSFEDWASGLGYDTESRKAESIFRACDAIGRKLAAGVPKAALEKARELLADY